MAELLVQRTGMGGVVDAVGWGWVEVGWGMGRGAYGQEAQTDTADEFRGGDGGARHGECEVERCQGFWFSK